MRKESAKKRKEKGPEMLLTVVANASVMELGVEMKSDVQKRGRGGSETWGTFLWA